MSSEIRSYRDLKAWQKGMAICLKAYAVTAAFPKHEMFGLVQQVRRCGVSIPANIAEGLGRQSRPDYIRFLRTARGSLCELETEITLAQQLAYVAAEKAAEFLAHLEECSRILQGLIASLERKEHEVRH